MSASTEILCPLECIYRETDWLEKHQFFVLTLIGLLGGGCGVLLTYFLRSRCTKIMCCGMGCDREPLTVDEIERVITPQAENNVHTLQ